MKISHRILVGALLPISIAGFLWPFFVNSHHAARGAQWVFLVATTLSIFLTVAVISRDEIGSKNVAFLGILTALIAALRPLGIGAIGIEPMWFALIIFARAMGPTFGFLLGALSVFLSALLTGGMGPWLSYQVFAAAVIGFGVGVIPRSLRGKREIVLLGIYGLVASEIFGILMDLQFWPWALGGQTSLSYLPGAALKENLSRFLSYHFLSALAWDIPRALLTVTLIAVAGAPTLIALRRAQKKSFFFNAEEFAELSDVRLNHR